MFLPKYRRKILLGKRRRRFGWILRDLRAQKGIELLEGHGMLDHVHMVVNIPPKYSLAYMVGLLKGKRAAKEGRRAATV